MMRRSVLFALCWLALLSGLPSYSALAANNNVSQIELTAQKELLQTQIEAIKGLHQKDADAINKRIDDQLAQVGQGVDRFGVIVSVLGTLVSLLLAGLGLLGYVTVSNKTKIEAEKAAQDWFDANEQNLKQRLSDVDKLAADAHQNILAAQHGVDQQAQDVHDAMDRMQTQIGKVPLDQTGGDAFDVSADARVVLERAQQLEKTPESSYSFDDWNTRGHAAYSRNAFDEAAYLWLKASKIPNAGAVNVAQVLFNRGLAQGEVGQSQEEIKTYDEVLHRFGDASELALKEHVARSLVNKGFRQGQLGLNEEAIKISDEVLRRFGDASELALKELMAQALLNKGVRQGHLGQSEEEIKTYDEVLRRFSDASELVLKEPLAKALVIKGITQSQLGQSEAAIKSYDEVLCRFGDASEFALKERVAQALVNKGNTQRQLGQSEEAIKTYDEVLRRFGDASEVALKEQVADALNVMGFSFLTQAKAQWADRYAANALLLKARECFTHAITKMPQTWGMALGNRAYAHWLMGNPTDAETDFAAGLRAEKFAGQDLYEGTLKDFETHPIAEDQSMRAMVDRLWVDYQNEKTGAVGHA